MRALDGQCTNLIALVRNPINLPATEVISDWIDNSQAQKAIQEAHTIIHLAGNLKPKDGNYVKTNVQTAETVVSALNPSKKQRIIFFSYVGVRIDSPNAYYSYDWFTESTGKYRDKIIK